MKININTINTYIITLNLITFISLLNMTYIFVRNIASDFWIVNRKSNNIFKGFIAILDRRHIA
ncbi:hypothetical protein AM231_14705 [Paenibacillus solani]|uniref:Uncharacterized protein n=1 Tax=Paenibacillus solani TaxID=1705565 RepID=A0A0M1P702_9BACL|nr:hypothetical protein AM231_14705 [Paenibacillus solani]